MKLVAYDKNKLGTIQGYKPTRNYLLLEEFIESDMECAKIDDDHHSSAASLAASFNNSIKRYKKFNVKVVIRKGEVFLVKKH